jgi:hypothetical protein
MQPCKGWLVEYIDKSCQTNDSTPNQEQVEYIPTKGHMHTTSTESNSLTLTPKNNTTSTTKSTSTKYLAIIPFVKKKPIVGLHHILIYEWDEHPKQHWFVCEKYWDVVDIVNEEKQMAKFGPALRARALTLVYEFYGQSNMYKE